VANGVGACAIGAVLIAARQQGLCRQRSGSPAPGRDMDRSIFAPAAAPVDTERCAHLSARHCSLAKPDHAAKT